MTAEAVACVRGNVVTSPVLSQQGIPPRRCCKKPVHYSKRLDRKVHKIENLFSRLKDWRPIATRYDGCTHVFRSAILLAAAVLFW